MKCHFFTKVVWLWPHLRDSSRWKKEWRLWSYQGSFHCVFKSFTFFYNRSNKNCSSILTQWQNILRERSLNVMILHILQRISCCCWELRLLTHLSHYLVTRAFILHSNYEGLNASKGLPSGWGAFDSHHNIRRDEQNSWNSIKGVSLTLYCCFKSLGFELVNELNVDDEGHISL